MSVPTSEEPLARNGASHHDRSTPLMRAFAGESPRSDSANTITLNEVLEVLRRWWWLVGAAAVLGLVSAAAWVLGDVPRYRATALLRVGEGREAVTSGIETPVGRPDRYVNPLTSQVQLIRSRSLIGEVVDSVGFRLQPDYKGFQPRLLEAVGVAPEAIADTLWLEFGAERYSVRTQRGEQDGVYGEPIEIDGVRFVLAGQPSTKHATWSVTSRERAVDRLLANLRVAAREETNIVDVSFDHLDPATAQLVANTLVRRYQAFDATFAQERARRRRIFLEEQLAQTDASLAQAQRQLTAFRTRARTYNARDELAAQQENRLALSIRREELDADRRMFRNLLNRLNDVSDTERWEVLRTLVSSPAIAENAVVSQIHAQLLRYQTSLDSLTTGEFANAATNPDVLRLRALIAGAEEELIGAIRSHLSSLDARARALDELSRRMAGEIAALPPQLAEEARLAQIVETYRMLGDQLREEYQKAGMAEAVAVGQADIVDLAARPYKPLSGMRALKLALGLFVGLALGGGGAFFLEHRNSSVRRREEVEGLFQLPLLAVIPRAIGSDLASPEWSLVPQNGARKVDPEGNDEGEPRDEEDAAADATKDAEKEETRYPVYGTDATHASEAYRMLRTNLLFGRSARDVKTLVITSTAPREGKTLTAMHLAASIAEEGPRVLLIDGDLWRGRIHEVAGISEAPGLAELLAGEEAPDAVRNTGMPCLYLLPRGKSHPSPSSLTKSTQIRRLLRKFGEEYDVIIIDAPPVLATAGGPALAAVADGVMLVIRAGQTERAAVREALRQLGTVGANIVGAVLNDPSGMTFLGKARYYYAYARK